MDRAVGDDEPSGDGTVAQPLGHQGQHLPLPRTEPLQPGVLAGAGEQLGHDLGVDGGTAARDPAERVHELLDPADPLLEQVAEPVDATGQQVGGEGLLHVGGQHQNGEPGAPPPRLDGRPDPFVGVGGRHAHVQDGDVGLVRVDGGEHRIGGVRGGHHVQSLGPQQQGEPLAQQRIVLGDHDPQGAVHGTFHGVTFPHPARGRPRPRRGPPCTGRRDAW